MPLSSQKYGFGIRDPGFRGQKGTGSRIRIRNTACVMIPIGPSTVLPGMARPVSSRSLSGILSRPLSCLFPLVCFQALNIHTAPYLTGQIVPFFIHTDTHTVDLERSVVDPELVGSASFWLIRIRIHFNQM
jgi:hypothetical protein